MRDVATRRRFGGATRGSDYRGSVPRCPRRGDVAVFAPDRSGPRRSLRLSKVEDFLGLHYCNADRIHPEWQQLAPDDTVWLAPKGWMGLRSTVMPCGRSTSSPYGDDRSRLLVRSRTALRHPGQVLAVEFARSARAFITRRMLIGIRRRAESQVQAEACAKRASDDITVWSIRTGDFVL